MRLLSFRFPVERVEGEDAAETLPRVAAVLDEDVQCVDLTAALPEQWQPVDPLNFLGECRAPCPPPARRLLPLPPQRPPELPWMRCTRGESCMRVLGCA